MDMVNRSRVGLLSLDIGTTHCKAALFTEAGQMLQLAKRPTLSHRTNDYEYYDPEQIWETCLALIRECLEKANGISVASIGITSMAESGLLVEHRTGRPCSPFIPWYSSCARKQSEMIAAESNRLERFLATGLQSSFKFGLSKLLWLKDRHICQVENAVWLSAADYIAFRLTGKLATDYTLAARTFAFRIDHKAWDEDWLSYWGFTTTNFPEAAPSGTPIGQITNAISQLMDVPEGTPVIIAGHDHVVAAFAAGANTCGRIMDSIGTAETLVGTLEERPLTADDLASGLSFGCHNRPGTMFWMGGNSSSGGSVEWLRGLLSDPELSYDQVIQLLEGLKPSPTGILYYPYLAGSGAPWPEANAKAAFIGLKAGHGRGDLLKAVLEGTAYEMESIFRAANLIKNTPINEVIVAGGGTQNRQWLQIKANVSGRTMNCIGLPEAALFGAALLAGIGAKHYSSYAQAQEVAASVELGAVVYPEWEQHEKYQLLYEQGYLPLQHPLRSFYRISN